MHIKLHLNLYQVYVINNYAVTKCSHCKHRRVHLYCIQKQLTMTLLCIERGDTRWSGMLSTHVKFPPCYINTLAQIYPGCRTTSELCHIVCHINQGDLSAAERCIHAFCGRVYSARFPYLFHILVLLIQPVVAGLCVNRSGLAASMFYSCT